MEAELKASPSGGSGRGGELAGQGTRRCRGGWLLLVIAGLALCFAKPLFELARYAAGSEFYSYILLIPFISIYLVWSGRKEAGGQAAETQHGGEGLDDCPGIGGGSTTQKAWPVAGGVPLAVGAGAVLVYGLALGFGWQAGSSDRLAVTMLAFVALVGLACVLCLDRRRLQKAAFPVAFLVFLVPFPKAVSGGLEAFFQHTSAYTAYLMLSGAGTAVVRDGLQLQVPGVTLVVAEECSGIRSSMVLLITAFLAGHLFLGSPWKKAILVLSVVPLAIVRNGFRIFTIAELSSHIGPQMLDSPIHHRGGPIFFVLSLVPFFLLLYWLRRRERRR